MIAGQFDHSQLGLIGHTGFVGGHLRKQCKFDRFFNSQNIGKVTETSFETLVCAAAPGSMFIANKFPEQDEAGIKALIDDLLHVKAKSFILISSIAVFEDFAGKNTECSTEFQNKLAYGRNRRLLEVFVEESFEQSLIVRLPALFGRDLRKNFIFDLLNPVPSMLPLSKFDSLTESISSQWSSFLKELYEFDSAMNMFRINRGLLNADKRRLDLEEVIKAQGFSTLSFYNPDSTYQYYDMNKLWSDINVAISAGLSHIHLAPEPLKAGDIYRHLIGAEMPNSAARLHREDMRTQHSDLWGRSEQFYLYDCIPTLERLSAFFQTQGRPS